MQRIVIDVYKDVLLHGSGSQMPIAEMERRYSNGDLAHLILHVAGLGFAMTWQQWGMAARGIGNFIDNWDCVEFYFDVEAAGQATRIGTGILVRGI